MLGRRRAAWVYLALATAAAGACGKSSDGDDDDGGGAAGETGDSAGRSTGGASGGSSVGGQGGAAPSGGADATGGTDSAGGAPAQAGGTDSSGGVESVAGGGNDGSGGTDTAGSDGSGGSTGGSTAGKGSNTGGAGGVAGGGGTGVCGDAYRDPDEECDDGNDSNGDGCHADCTIESGFVCSSARCDSDGVCKLVVPAIFRDFNAHAATGGHPDFQPGFNSDGATQGLVEPLLDGEGKPVLSSVATVANSYIHGASGFAQWYRDAAPSSGAIPGELVLWDDGSDHYANRWGRDGERWKKTLSIIDYGTVTVSGYTGDACAACTPTATGACYDPCTPFDSTTYSCCAEIPVLTEYDGTPLFFPIDSGPGLLTEPRGEGKIPDQYGWNGWPWETDAAATLGISTPIETAEAPFPSETHNFSFTSEVKTYFRYRESGSYAFELGGDDDIWLFVNGQLALDLGGWHTPLEAYLTIAGGTVTSQAVLSPGDSAVVKTATAESFGLEDGKVYPIAVFHAERQLEGSSFKFGVSGLDGKRSVCVPEP